VRRSGTVGTDEGVLRSVLPAPEPAQPPVSGAGSPADRPATGTERGARRVAPATDPAVERRSLDDQDLGWGDWSADSNDDRLRLDKPPHW
jgi:hypothetical protein